MPVLKNPRHEAFARAVIKEGTAGKAYRSVYPEASAPTAETQGPKKLRDHQIRIRVDELREEIEKKAADALVMERVEAMQFCSQVVRTPVGEVTEHSPLAQEVTHAMTQFGPTTKIKMPGKLDALKLLGSWRKWEPAVIVEAPPIVIINIGGTPAPSAN